MITCCRGVYRHGLNPLFCYVTVDGVLCWVRTYTTDWCGTYDDVWERLPGGCKSVPVEDVTVREYTLFVYDYDEED